jgi:hypothetical protein
LCGANTFRKKALDALPPPAQTSPDFLQHVGKRVHVAGHEGIEIIQYCTGIATIGMM